MRKKHIALLINKERFEDNNFRIIKIQAGVISRVGRIKGADRVQAIQFSSSQFTVAQAKDWLQNHNLKCIDFKGAPKVKSFKKSILLQSYRIQSFSNNEILAMIEPVVLQKIKQKDPRPFFQVYSICHEGTSNPKVLGETEQKPIHWTRKAVQSLKNIALKGVKFFLGHNADNSTTDRRPYGKVVAEQQKEIDGVLHQLVVSYHRPQDVEAAKQMDICSQEGEWTLFEGAKNIIAGVAKAITGVALGNSDQQQPAFAGAKRYGMVQAFDSAVGDTELKIQGQETSTMPTFAEIKQAIKEMSIYPGQLYNIEDLKNDNKFGVLFTERANLEKQVKTLEDEKKLIENEKQDLIKKNQVATVKDRAATVMSELKLTDKQKTFVNSRFEKYNGDITDDGLKSFVETQVNEFQELAKLFEPEKDGKDRVTNNKQSDGGSDPEDYTKAENNEFLSEDYD
jgi:uncharacterized protein YdcH (DUF465 family)